MHRCYSLGMQKLTIDYSVKFLPVEIIFNNYLQVVLPHTVHTSHDWQIMFSCTYKTYCTLESNTANLLICLRDWMKDESYH